MVFIRRLTRRRDGAFELSQAAFGRKGEGRREKGEGRREKGEGRRKGRNKCISKLD
jgi:hypothetical protein